MGIFLYRNKLAFIKRCNIFCNNKSIIFQNFSVSAKLLSTHEVNVLIVGGGTGGCTLAAKLSSKLGPNNVTILEPAITHYYQPMFTLIGGGMKLLEHSCKPMSTVLPKNVKWIKDKAIEFSPDCNTVRTATGIVLQYNVLLIAIGLQLNYDKIPGLLEALSIPNGKVCSIYSPKYVGKTYQCLQTIQHGNAIFTFPASAVKCPGAPQKIVYIADHYFRKTKKRNNINVIYNTSLPVLFGVPHYAEPLWKIVKERNITVNTRRNLVEVNFESNTAVFQDLDNPSQLYEEKYSMLHVVPPMSTPDELYKCKELVNDAGFVDVDKLTLQHPKFKNIFAIGDCSGSPNSKTGASVAAQSPVLYKNIIDFLNGNALRNFYDGYASCPLVTGYGTCILAEFDYNLTPLETFPFDQREERYSMYILKKNVMPILYWNLFLKGFWNGPAALRKLLNWSRFKNN